jgi:hypothetical protein
MQLALLQRLLDVRLVRAERSFTDAITRTDKDARAHQLEGALSEAWQAYCAFVREVCIESAIGATTSGGTVTVPSITPSSRERASYIAVRAAKKEVIKPGGTNTVLRFEPTWGDGTKIGLVVAALKPSNGGQLKAYLLGGLPGPKHCQVVRNATAHRNKQTLAEVIGLAPSYAATGIVHPTDALRWTTPTSGAFAFLSWLEDMRIIATGAVS